MFGEVDPLMNGGMLNVFCGPFRTLGQKHYKTYSKSYSTSSFPMVVSHERTNSALQNSKFVDKILSSPNCSALHHPGSVLRRHNINNSHQTHPTVKENCLRVLCIALPNTT